MVLTEGNKRPLDRLIAKCQTEQEFYDLFERMIRKAAVTRAKAELRGFATEREFYDLEALDYAVEQVMRAVEKRFDIDISADIKEPNVLTTPGRKTFEIWVKEHIAKKKDAEGK